MEPVHSVFMVLFVNNLLIGYPSNTPDSKYPFRLIANYALETLAVVNVKSHSSTDTLSKIEFVLQFLIFPEQMYVKCESARQKREWLDTIEQTKRKQEHERSLIRQATIRGITYFEKLILVIFFYFLAKRNFAMSSIASPLQKQNNSKLNSVLENSTLSNEENMISKMSSADTQWLNDLIDELHVVISDRHMEQAVEMLLEWKSCGCKDMDINTKFQVLKLQV